MENFAIQTLFRANLEKIWQHFKVKKLHKNLKNRFVLNQLQHELPMTRINLDAKFG